MNIVFVASEAVPFAKTGGLADVAGALPKALHGLGHGVCLFLPCHRSAGLAGLELADTGLVLRVPVGAKVVEGHVRESRLPGSRGARLSDRLPGVFRPCRALSGGR